MSKIKACLCGHEILNFKIWFIKTFTSSFDEIQREGREVEIKLISLIPSKQI